MYYMGQWILASHCHKGNISHVMEQLHLLHEDAYNTCASNWCHLTYVSFVTQIGTNVLSLSLSPVERDRSVGLYEKTAKFSATAVFSI